MTILIFILIVVLSSCTHDLEVINKKQFQSPEDPNKPEEKLIIGVTPFSGTEDEEWLHQELLSELRNYENVEAVVENYKLNRIEPSPSRNYRRVNFVLTLEPDLNYKSSIMNWFPINWPGFLVFAPGWNGYVYTGAIQTYYKINGTGGSLLEESSLQSNYKIRQADFDRAAWAGMGFTDGGVVFPNATGIYNWYVPDPDIKKDFREAIRDNYVSYVLENINFQVSPELRDTKEEDETPETEAPGLRQPDQETIIDQPPRIRKNRR